MAVFLLGLAYQLRLVQAAQGRTRASGWSACPLGRWLLGLSEAPPAPPAYAQTLLVQPNLEIIAYRQGLTPRLIARLGLFAAWKNLGAACTLQLQPETVYRALEAGQTFDTILQTLEQHGMRPTPPAVLESLRTWANKRERISVYPSATLFEFTSAEDLNEALARGLPGTRLSDRLAWWRTRSDVDFRHFRLSGTRDYALPPEKCVEVEEDGVTLTIDLTQSDLLLETELPRFAEPLNGTPANGRRQYRLTPASLAAAQNSGLGLRVLEEWFVQRTGQPLSPSARLLLTGPLVPPLELRTRLVLQVQAPGGSGWSAAMAGYAALHGGSPGSDGPDGGGGARGRAAETPGGTGPERADGMKAAGRRHLATRVILPISGRPFGKMVCRRKLTYFPPLAERLAAILPRKGLLPLEIPTGARPSGAAIRSAGWASRCQPTDIGSTSRNQAHGRNGLHCVARTHRPYSRRGQQNGLDEALPLAFPRIPAGPHDPMALQGRCNDGCGL